MVKLQWPIAREKRDATGILEGEASEKRKEEAFTKIQGEENLSNRIRYEDECNVAIINHLLEQLKMLIEKTEKTSEDLQLIKDYNALLVSWEEYRATRKAAVAWSAAGENHDMSERYGAYETYFSRNWMEPWKAKKILRFSAYLRDIAFQEWHVTPSPTVLIDKPVVLGRQLQGIDPNAIAAGAKLERVARNKN